MIVSAAKVFPVAGAPVDRGAVRLVRGRVGAIGSSAELIASFPGERHFDFGDCVMIPGLVNAHTHLEYTALSELARPTHFVPWVRKLVERASVRNRFWGPPYWEKSAAAGAERSLRSGITTVGDVVTFGGSLKAAAATGIRMRAYLEAVAVGDEAVEKTVKDLENRLSSSFFDNPALSPGLSPHSVYTLSPRALSALASLRRRLRLPLAMHLAESKDEVELLRGEGGLAGQIERWRLPFGSSFTGSLSSYLEDAGLLSANTLLVHAVHLGPEGLAAAAARGASIVTCPRSNIRLGCGLPDYLSWKDRGIRFCYGTDSLASVPSFDLFAEARMVRDVLEENPATVLQRLTLGGAEVLQLDDVTGTLEPGKAGDIVLLRLPPGADTEEDVVTFGSPERVAATVVGGRFLFRDPRRRHPSSGKG